MDERELLQAIANSLLFVDFQPIFRLSTGEMTGAEALVRWNHPELGIVTPGAFIPAAEESGLIVPIGEFVLEQACAQLRTWQMLNVQHLSVSVNVSAVQLTRSDFVRAVRACIADYGVRPDRLQIEITETMPFAHREIVSSRLCELRELGVRIILDDFGCGYMSLAHLTTLSVDGLKIDRSFTCSLPDVPKTALVVTAVIELAERLGLSVVVEGVETERQAQWLRRFGKIGVQGFLRARPRAPMRTSADLVSLRAAGLPRSILCN